MKIVPGNIKIKTVYNVLSLSFYVFDIIIQWRLQGGNISEHETKYLLQEQESHTIKTQWKVWGHEEDYFTHNFLSCALHPNKYIIF